MENPTVTDCSLSCQYNRSSAGTSFDQLKECVENGTCSHVSLLPKSRADKIEFLAYVEPPCLFHNGALGSDCGKQGDKRIWLVGKPVAPKSGRISVNPVLLTGTLRTLTPQLIQLLDESGGLCDQVPVPEILVAPYTHPKRIVDLTSMGDACVSFEWFPQQFHQIGKAQIFFSARVKEAPGTEVIRGRSRHAEIKITVPGRGAVSAKANLVAADTIVSEPNREDNSAQANLRSAELLSLLRPIDELVLSRFSVVGACARFDARPRAELRDWSDRIRSVFSRGLRGRTNFLVWAAPGSGKSFFVEQVAKSLGDNIKYIEINLAQCDEELFRAKLLEAKGYEKDVICLIDEVDGKQNEDWPYDALMPYLDLNDEAAHRRVFILVGSYPGGRDAMVQHIQDRKKGCDAMDRVPVTHRFDIPTLSDGDRLIVFVRQLLNACAGKHSLKRIEKMALFYVLASEEFATARQLREIAVHAVQQIGGEADVLRYEHLFAYGNALSRLFPASNPNANDLLSGSFVEIAE